MKNYMLHLADDGGHVELVPPALMEDIRALLTRFSGKTHNSVVDTLDGAAREFREKCLYSTDASDVDVERKFEKVVNVAYTNASTWSTCNDDALNKDAEVETDEIDAGLRAKITEFRSDTMIANEEMATSDPTEIELPYYMMYPKINTDIANINERRKVDLKIDMAMGGNRFLRGGWLSTSNGQKNFAVFDEMRRQRMVTKKVVREYCSEYANFGDFASFFIEKYAKTDDLVDIRSMADYAAHEADIVAVYKDTFVMLMYLNIAMTAVLDYYSAHFRKYLTWANAENVKYVEDAIFRLAVRDALLSNNAYTTSYIATMSRLMKMTTYFFYTMAVGLVDTNTGLPTKQYMHVQVAYDAVHITKVELPIVTRMLIEIDVQPEHMFDHDHSRVFRPDEEERRVFPMHNSAVYLQWVNIGNNGAPRFNVGSFVGVPAKYETLCTVEHKKMSQMAEFESILRQLLHNRGHRVTCTNSAIFARVYDDTMYEKEAFGAHDLITTSELANAIISINDKAPIPANLSFVSEDSFFLLDALVSNEESLQQQFFSDKQRRWLMLDIVHSLIKRKTATSTLFPLKSTSYYFSLADIYQNIVGWDQAVQKQ